MTARGRAATLDRLVAMVEAQTGVPFEAPWWVNASRKELGAYDPATVTVATALARRLAFFDRPPAPAESSRQATERQLVALWFEGAELARQQALLDLLHRVAPGDEPVVRTQVLATLGPGSDDQAACWEEMVGLSERLGRALATKASASRGRFPRSALHDEAVADRNALRRELRGLPDERVALIGLSLFPEGSDERRWHEAYGPRFLRRLARSDSVAKVLVVNSGWNRRATVPWEAVAHAWRQADLLAAVARIELGPPLAVGATELARVRVTPEAIERYELTLETDYLREELALGPEPSRRARRSAFERIYKGTLALKEILAAAERAGMWLGAHLRLPRGPAKGRFCGVEPDEDQIDLETQTAIAAFGCGVLASPELDDLHRAWDALWTYGLRPRESALPWPWGRAPLGRHHAGYVSATAGKTGRRAVIEPSAATELLGFGPGWLFARPANASEEAWCRLAALRAAEACRYVRERWVDDGHPPIPGRTAYFVRHAVADQLRWGLREHPEALALALGHLSGVTDAPYTQVSMSELRDAISACWVDWLQAAGRGDVGG